MIWVIVTGLLVGNPAILNMPKLLLGRALYCFWVEKQISPPKIRMPYALGGLLASVPNPAWVPGQ